MTTIITYTTLIFSLLGAADRICGNKYGLGSKFEQAFFTMGSLALSMVGMLVIAPVIARLLSPVMTPVFTLIGADPAVFAGIFLGTDMGAAPLAEALAKNPESGKLAGYITSSMMGATIVFHIPVAMEIAGKDSLFIARGMIFGLIAIPFGCVSGGLIAGFPISLVLHDVTPVVIISILLVIGIIKCREYLVKGFIVLGKIIQGISTIGLVFGIIQSCTGKELIKGIMPVHEAFSVVATVAIFLAGAFPLMHILTIALKRPLFYLGKKLGINEISAIGLILTLVNSIPMLESMKDMDPRGKIVNAAFCVTSAFTLGDFFGYVAATDKEMLFPMISGKIVAGIVAILLSLLVTYKDTI